jgi:hypothetical protein
MLAFDAWAYLQPFMVWGLTNLFIQGAIFFAAGALSRSTIVIYTQGIILFVLYQVSDTLLQDIDNKTLSAILDPFGIRAFGIFTEYWSPAQNNLQIVPLEGILLWNRLVWGGFGFLILAATYYLFSFNVVRNSFFKKKANKEIKEKILNQKEKLNILLTNLNANEFRKLKKKKRMDCLRIIKIFYKISNLNKDCIQHIVSFCF